MARMDFSRMLDAIGDPELASHARASVYYEYASVATVVEDVREAVILALLGMGDPTSEEHMVGVPRDQWDAIVNAVADSEALPTPAVAPLMYPPVDSSETGDPLADYNSYEAADTEPEA